MSNQVQSGFVDLRSAFNFGITYASFSMVEDARGVTVTEATGKCLKAKSAAGFRPTYIKSLEQSLSHFAVTFGSRPLGDIKADEIELWLDANKAAPATRATRLSRLSALFSYSARKGWIGENPVNRVERMRFTVATPKVLSVSDCKQVLFYTLREKPHALAWVTLCLLAGLRPDEPTVHPLKKDGVDWSHINLESKTVRVEAAVTKSVRRRIVHLSDNAVDWLREAQRIDARLPLNIQSKRRYQRQLRHQLGVKHWPKDVLRHTAASMMLATNPNAAAVAMELGNSERILLKHYRELVNKEDAAAFWSILPPKRQLELALS